MSFGKRNISPDRLSMAGKGSSGNGWSKPNPNAARETYGAEDETAGIAPYAVGGLTAAILIALAVFYDDLPPVTYTPQKIYISKSGGTNYNKYRGIFSATMPTQETVDGGQHTELADLCVSGRLPTEAELKGIPPRHIHAELKKVRSYLVCAMQNRLDRFCQKMERKIFVKQMEAYLQMRAAAQGVEAMFDRHQSGAAAAHVQTNFFLTMGAISERDVKRYKLGTKVSKVLAPSMTEEISNLSRNGYLSRWDFHWTGVMLPEAVAPFFKKATSDSICTQQS